MFTVTACKVKQNAPRCHTFLEIVYARYGALTHVVFIFFALATNILVASQLLLGGSAVVTALTGMNVYAACWLIPLGVALYVVLGGLRATFLCRSWQEPFSPFCFALSDVSSLTKQQNRRFLPYYHHLDHYSILHV